MFILFILFIELNYQTGLQIIESILMSEGYLSTDKLSLIILRSPHRQKFRSFFHSNKRRIIQFSIKNFTNDIPENCQIMCVIQVLQHTQQEKVTKGHFFQT
jgi:hypothetical protein